MTKRYGTSATAKYKAHLANLIDPDTLPPDLGGTGPDFGE